MEKERGSARLEGEMYDVARFVKPKREDWDNGCGQTERADMDALRYERTQSPTGEAVRVALRMGHIDCPNIGCHDNIDRRCCAGAVCDAMRTNADLEPARKDG
jgi:hypothetical protein